MQVGGEKAEFINKSAGCLLQLQRPFNFKPS